MKITPLCQALTYQLCCASHWRWTYSVSPLLVQRPSVSLLEEGNCLHLTILIKTFPRPTGVQLINKNLEKIGLS